MTNKQRKLFDAIMGEFTRIDSSDDFLYFRISNNVEKACDFCSKDINASADFDELDAVDKFWFSRIKSLIEKRKSTKLSKFFRECPLSADFKVVLRDYYIKVRRGEDFFIGHEFDTIKLRFILWHLSKF